MWFPKDQSARPIVQAEYFLNFYCEVNMITQSVFLLWLCSLWALAFNRQ